MNTETKLSELFGGFLKASDLGGREVTVTISSVTIETMADGESKPVLHFAGKDRALVLNKTNRDALLHAFGDVPLGGLGGKSIILYPQMTEFKGVPKEGIRLRAAEVADDTPF